MSRLHGSVGVLLVALMCVGVLALWMRLLAESERITTKKELCEGYVTLHRVLDTDLLSQSGRVRAASRLADLAERFPDVTPPNSLPVSRAPHQIRTVLRADYATVRDLFSAAHPIAAVCGLEWRTGSPKGVLVHG